ncbi:hypothetical protein HO913_01655 [Streptococcus suis]|nr:hypothetical protein [Streptococcus suis]NQN52375.1 hypothetical protein [Streptococcus suis]NQP58032.1 hypothetical protein [Streptococcus suis]
MAVDVIHAWHGTTQKNAQQIRNQGFKKTTIDFNETNLRNPNDLGEGIYCFIDSMYGNGKQMAARYAHSYRDSIAKKQGCSIEVIEVEAAVQSSMMLDLDDADTREIFIQFSQKHEMERTKIQYRLRNDGANRRKNYDGIMVELFVRHINKQLKENAVQAVKKDTCTIFDGIISNFPNGTELCIRDTTCVALIEKEKMSHGDEFKKFL